MNEDQREALQASIRHWGSVVKQEARGEPLSIGTDFCPLCMYGQQQVDLGRCACICDACPIAQHTRQYSCMGTPYALVIRGSAPASRMFNWLSQLERGEKPRKIGL